MTKHDCGTCKALYALDDALPPCAECIPVLFATNRVALQVWGAVKDQVIVGFNGVISINHLAVWTYMDRFSISCQRNVFEKVMFIFEITVRKEREDAAAENELNSVREKLKTKE